MASAWAQLSKEDQAAWSASGMDKATYNSKYGKGGATAPKPPKSSSSSSSSNSNSSSSSNSNSSSSSNSNSSSSSSSSQAEAKERSQSWADLSKEEKNEKTAAGETKKSYNKSTGYRAEQIAIDNSTANTQSNNNNSSSSSNNSSSSRGNKGPGQHATEGLSDYSQLTKEQRQTSPVTKKAYNRRVGDGSTSKYDIKTKVKGGADLAELTRLQESGSVTDAAAQQYLAKKIKQLTPKSTDPPQGGGNNPPPGTIDPPRGRTNPPPGGGTNPPPGGGTNPPPGGGTNPPPGGGIGSGPGDDTVVITPGDGSVGVGGDNNGQVQTGQNNNQIGGDVTDSQVVAGDNNGQMANNGGVAMGDNSSIEQSVGNTKGNQTNNWSMGDNSWFIGNNNQGADYSVVIGNNSVGGGGSGSSPSNTLTNMQNAVAYGALNNNAWYKSQSDLSGLGRASQAIAAADAFTGSNKRIAGLDYQVRNDQLDWFDRANKQTGLYLGDVWNFTPTPWVMPENQENPDFDPDDDD